MLNKRTCLMSALSICGLFVILSCAVRTFNNADAPNGERFVGGSVQRTSELALAASWTALNGSYPGIYRTSYRATGASGNTFTVNAVRVDLKTPGIKLSTSPRIANGWQDGVQETLTKRVSQFITSSQSTTQKIAVAINTDAFNLTNASKSVPTNLIGYAVSDGILVSAPGSGRAGTLFWDQTGGAKIESTFVGSPNTQTIGQGMLATSGFNLVLINGVVQGSDATLAARSGIGLSPSTETNHYLYMITIENGKIGRVSSSGATISQLGEQLKSLGAENGIHLDGGGSTQMGYWNPATSSFQLLGGTDTRYVGAHLGVYFSQQ